MGAYGSSVWNLGGGRSTAMDHASKFPPREGGDRRQLTGALSSVYPYVGPEAFEATERVG